MGKLSYRSEMRHGVENGAPKIKIFEECAQKFCPQLFYL
jgi:hypothetical protein